MELLGTGAKVLTGCAAGGLFGGNTNPVASLIVGMLVTVLLQSSSTTTSIIVSLVGANAIPVGAATYMVCLLALAYAFSFITNRLMFHSTSIDIVIVMKGHGCQHWNICNEYHCGHGANGRRRRA